MLELWWSSTRSLAKPGNSRLCPGTDTTTGKRWDIIPFGEHDWRVLDVQGGRALIITENIITNRVFRLWFFSSTWETSSIRELFNSNFMRRFSEGDRRRILETRVINNDNPWFGTDGGQDTYDSIFLLSVEEVVRYFGESGRLAYQYHPRNDWWGFFEQYNGNRVARTYSGLTMWWWVASHSRQKPLSSISSSCNRWCGSIWLLSPRHRETRWWR